MKKLSPLVLLTLLLLGANLFGLAALAPASSESAPGMIGSLIYAAVRILLLLALSYVAARYFGRARFDVIRLITFVVFIEQVIFKGAWYVLRQEPIGPTLLGLGMGYIVFFPFIFLLGFLGSELGKWQRAKSLTNPETNSGTKPGPT